MKKKVLAAGCALAVCLFSGGYVLGQQADNSDELLKGYTEAEANFSKYVHYNVMADLTEGEEKQQNERKAETLGTTTGLNLSAAYARGVQNSKFSQTLLASTLTRYQIGKSSARSAPQASQVAAEATAELAILHAMQNQRLIEQNDRIIKLLEEKNK